MSKPINCPECQASLQSSENKCPECGAGIIAFNGQEWTTMTGAEKFNIYAVFTSMSGVVAWLIVSVITWFTGDIEVSFMSADAVYYSLIALIGAGIYYSTMKAFKRGDMNS